MVGDQDIMLNAQMPLSDGVIQLKTLTTEDAPALHKMLSDEYLCDKAGLITHTHVNQTIDFIFEGNYEMKHGYQYFYGIFSKDTLVGLINFFNLSYIDFSGEYGYFISSDHTRNGYMERSVKLLSNYILEETNIKKINIYIDTSNKASLALVKKLGLEAQGKDVEEDLQNRSVEMLRYEITKSLK